MPALRVPCDARMNRRDVKLAIAQTVTYRTLRLILCFSANLDGGFKIQIKDKGQTTIRHSGIILAGIDSFKDPGYRLAPV